MKSIIKKAAALFLAGAMLTGFSACADKESASEHNGEHGDEGNLAGDAPSGDFNQDELPYGATMTQLLTSINDDISVSVEYDSRFLSEEEGKLVSNYLYAMTTGDAELMEQVFYPPLLDYSSKTAGYSSSKEYIEAANKNLIDSITTHVQEEVKQFDIDYIMITDCYVSGDPAIEEDLSGMDKMIAEGIGQEHIDKTDKATRKEIYVDFTYTVNGGADSYDYNYGVGHTIHLFIYNIDGKYYIV